LSGAGRRAAPALFASCGEKFFELAAVKPYAVAVCACVQDNGSLDAAVNTQQWRRIARASARRIIGLLILVAAMQRSYQAGIFGQKLAQLLTIKPNARTRRAAIDGDAFNYELTKIFCFAFRTFHVECYS
jgi:hypothetical protein